MVVEPPPALRPPLPPTLPPTLPGPVPPLWRMTPPAVFPPVLGLFALGLGWRRAAPMLPAPLSEPAAGFGEAVLGAVTMLALFAWGSYAAKAAARPGAVAEDLRILPGRGGLGAAVVAFYAFAAALSAYAPEAARALILGAGVLHLGLVALVLRAMLAGPAEGRVVTPVWHLIFVGFIVGAMAASAAGWPDLARAVFWPSLAAALAIWGISLWQILRRIPPPPLRPLLAIHLAPLSIFSIVAAETGIADAPVFAGLALALGLTLAASGRWLTAAGFSPLWGAFTFPAGALANAMLAQGWAVPGLIILVAATAAVPVIALRVWRMWPQGTLAARTNAAIA